MILSPGKWGKHWAAILWAKSIENTFVSVTSNWSWHHCWREHAQNVWHSIARELGLSDPHSMLSSLPEQSGSYDPIPWFSWVKPCTSTCFSTKMSLKHNKESKPSSNIFLITAWTRKVMFSKIPVFGSLPACLDFFTLHV